VIERTQLPRAYVVINCEQTPNLEKEIKKWVQERVASHKQLRGGVIIIDEIPKSPSGKILRRVLKDRVKNEEKNGGTGKAKERVAKL
jgi:4-coumarate--CoA ligase